MLLFDWLSSLKQLERGRTRWSHPRRRRRCHYCAAEVLEDRTLLSTLPVGDVGGTMLAAAETGIGPDVGFFCAEAAVEEGTDVDVFRLEASAGETLVISTEQPPGSGDALNTFVRLFDAEGNQLAFDDDGGPGLYSEARFTFEADGTYFVGVSGFPNLFYDPADDDPAQNPIGEEFLQQNASTGDYRLTLSVDSGGDFSDARDTGIGPAGGTFTRTELLGDGPSGSADVELFRFEATAGQFLTAETFAPAAANPEADASGSPPDTLLRLFDDNGNQLDINDDRDPAGGDLFSRIDFEILESGTYFVAVSASADAALPDSSPATSSSRAALTEYGLSINVREVEANAEIRGSKFNDRNANGTRDPGEEGLAGVTVFLDLNGNGLFDDGTEPEPSTVTDASGAYSFTGLLPGLYRVGEVVPDGFAQTAPGPSTFTSENAFLKATEEPELAFEDFEGFSGTVLETLDSSTSAGPIQPGDIPEGISFRSSLVQSNALGIFAENFDGQPDIQSDVLFSQFFGESLIVDFQPGVTAVGMDVVSFRDSSTIVVTVADGEGRLRDFEVTPPESDPGYFGIVVASGEIVRLELQPPSGITVGIDNIRFGSPDPAVDGSLRTAGVDEGETVAGIDFGNRVLAPGTIRGTKFNDLNANGVQDAGEQGLAGVTVFLDLNGNGVLEPGSVSPVPQISDSQSPALWEPHAVTDEQGNYRIEGLIPSTSPLAPLPDGVTEYTVVELVQPGFSPTGPASRTVTLTPENPEAVVNFGNVSVTEIRGTKFEDLDGDGVLDPGEPGIEGVTIFLDANDNRVLDAGESFTVTDASGNYVFSNLPPGEHIVREVVPAGSIQTVPRGASAAGRLFVVPLDGSNQIVELNPQTGQELNRFNAPTPTDFSTGLAFDGTSLFYISANNLDATLFELDPNTGFVRDSDVIGQGNNFDALAALNDRIYLADFANEDILEFDLLTDTVTNVLDIDGLNPGVNLEGGLAGITDPDRLVALNNFGEAVLEIDPLSGLVVTGFAGQIAYTGAAVIDGELYLGDFFGAPGIDVYSRDGTLLRQITPEFGPFTGVGGVGANPHDGAHRVTLSLGQLATGINFGNQRLGGIRGTKFNDLNGNGVRDAGEPGIPGVTVFLDQNNNGVPDAHPPTFVSRDVPLAISETDFVFSALDVSGLSGAITDVDVTLSIGHPFVSDLRAFLFSGAGTLIELFSNVGGSGDNFTLTTLDDQANRDITAGTAPFSGRFAPVGPLSAFTGENPNGTWFLALTDDFPLDTGTLDGWSLTITTDDPADLVRTEAVTVTDARGDYAFTDLRPGQYTVREIVPPGHVPTFPGSPAEALPHTVTLLSGQTVQGLDFGNFVPSAPLPGEIRGTKFFDSNQNGVRDAGEEGLEGVTIFLDLNANGLFDAATEPSTVTDADGNYSFTGLQPGVFRVGEVVPPGFAPVPLTFSTEEAFVEAAGGALTFEDFEGLSRTFVQSLDSSTSAGPIQPGDIPEGISFRSSLVQSDALGIFEQNFDEQPDIQSDMLFSQFFGESLIIDFAPGVTAVGMDVVSFREPETLIVTVEDETGALRQFEVTPPETDPGYFGIFVSQGEIVRLEWQPPEGITVGIDNIRFGSPPATRQVILEQGEIATGVDLGNVGTGEIRGTAFNDINANGIQDADEGPLTGVTIFLDENGNGTLDEAERSTVTGPEGRYAFSNLPPGIFTVAQIVSAGLQPTAPDGRTHTIQLAPGEIRTGVDFGNRGARVEGMKFSDLDGDGVRDPGEPGIAGFVIQAFDGGGNLVGQTVTRSDDPATPADEAGTYSLEVPAGAITVVEVRQEGFVQTAPLTAPRLLEVAGVLQPAFFDFENGAAGFAATGEWHLSGRRGSDLGHSASTSFYFGSEATGRYANNSFGTLTSPVISLPATEPALLEPVFLEFNHFLEIEDFFDTASVAILTSGGSQRTVIADNNAVGGLPDSTGAFQPVTLDISAFAGQDIRIEFAFESDFSVTREGWFVDDVAVRTGSPAASVPLTLAPGQLATGIDFGNFDLDTVGERVSTATPLLLNANGTAGRDGRIDRPGDVDVFQVTAPQDGFLAVRLTEAGPVDPFLRLLDASGNVLRSDDDGAGEVDDSLLALPVSAGQTFFVEASDAQGDAAGPYRLEVVSTGPGLPLPLNSLGPGQFLGTAFGDIANAGQVQVFQVDVPGGLPADSQLRIDLAQTAGSNLDTLLLLFDPATGELIDASDDLSPFVTSSQLIQPVAGGESFFVVAAGAGDSSGRFSLSARIGPSSDDFPDDIQDAVDLGDVSASPIVQDGRVNTAGDRDAFRIFVPAGAAGLLTIDLERTAASGLDTVVELRDPATGELIEVDDDGGTELNSRIQRQVSGGDEGREFIVAARGFSTSQGDYTLSVRLDDSTDQVGDTVFTAADLDARELAGGSVVQPGTIVGAGDVDVYRVEIPNEFDFPANAALRIRQNAVGAGTLDPFLRVFRGVFDADGTLLRGDLLALNDDVGFDPETFRFSFNSQTSVSVNSGDVLFVEAGAFGSSSGGYNLILDVADDFGNAPSGAAVVEPDAAGSAAQTGSIETAGDADFFRFTATVPGRVRIDLQGDPAVAPQRRLADPLLVVFQEFEDGRFREVARGDNADGTLDSRIELDVQAGDEFFVRAAGIGTLAGAYRLEVTTDPLASRRREPAGLNPEADASGSPDLGETFADAALVFDPNLPNLGLPAASFFLEEGDVDTVRFVAADTGTVEFNLTPLAGANLDTRLSAFRLVEDPSNPDGGRIPERIVSDLAGDGSPARTIRFAVTEGEQYFVQVQNLAGGSGAYRLNARQNGPGALPPLFVSADVGNTVLGNVRQTLLTIQVDDPGAVSEALVEQAVETFLAANGFDPTTSFLILVTDPVDLVLAEPTPGQDRQAGFTAETGRIDEFGNGFLSGDGIVELVILPTEAERFNLTLFGVGADFRFDARLLPAGATDIGGAIAATVGELTVGGLRPFTDRAGSLTRGNLELVLDFTGNLTFGGGPGGPGTIIAGGGTTPGLGTATPIPVSTQFLGQFTALGFSTTSPADFSPFRAESPDFFEGVTRTLAGLALPSDPLDSQNLPPRRDWFRILVDSVSALGDYAATTILNASKWDEFLIDVFDSEFPDEADGQGIRARLLDAIWSQLESGLFDLLWGLSDGFRDSGDGQDSDAGDSDPGREEGETSATQSQSDDSPRSVQQGDRRSAANRTFSGPDLPRNDPRSRESQPSGTGAGIPAIRNKSNRQDQQKTETPDDEHPEAAGPRPSQSAAAPAQS